MAKFIFLKNKLENNIRKLKDSFLKKGLNFEVFYSVKTNFAKEVLEVINNECKFEIVSKDEWEIIKSFNPNTIVLNGPSKSAELVEEIFSNGVNNLYFNTDNDTDLDIIDTVKDKYPSSIKMGLRVYLNKSGIWNRFGFDIDSDRVKEILTKYGKFIKGFHFHFSTNNFNISNYENILSKINNIIVNYDLDIEYIDIGGGLPGANESIYDRLVFDDLPRLLNTKGMSKYFIISEVGRHVVEDTFNMETNIVSIKKVSNDKYDVVIDTNILHFPCYWEKKFGIDFISIDSYSNKNIAIFINIYGNSCMQVDKISEGFLINSIPKVGDKILLSKVGAYSLSQASNFISKIPEIIFSF